MGLFRRKKRASQENLGDFSAEEFTLPEPPELTEPQELPQLPELPELPSLPNPPSLQEPLPQTESLQIPNLTKLEKPNLRIRKKRAKKRLIPISRPAQKRYEIRKPKPEALNSLEIPAPQPTIQPSPQPAQVNITRTGKPIFVKLSQYEDALEKINSIKDRVSKASELLTRVKEIRTREEQELTEWERELQEIKTKLRTVDERLFTNIE